MGNQAPELNLDVEQRLITLLLAGQSIFESAHDVSNGGVAATLSEMVLRHKIGAKVTLENPAPTLFAETPGQVVVAIEPTSTNDLVALAGKFQIPILRIGTSGGENLIINDADISLVELNQAFTETFPKLFG